MDDYSKNLTLRRSQKDVMTVSSPNTNRSGPPRFTFDEDFNCTAKLSAIDKEESWQGNYGNT